MPAEQRLFDLWTVPPDRRDDPEGAFRELYTDPVTINGTPVPVAGLVDRARALHAAFTDHTIEIVDRVETPGKLAPGSRHWVLSPPPTVRSRA
jgi:hypothetical protein